MAGGEGAEAAQLDTAAVRQTLGDFLEEGIDRALDILGTQLGIILAQCLQQLGPDHSAIPREKIGKTLANHKITQVAPVNGHENAILPPFAQCLMGI